MLSLAGYNILVFHFKFMMSLAWRPKTLTTAATGSVTAASGIATALPVSFPALAAVLAVVVPSWASRQLCESPTIPSFGQNGVPVFESE